VYVRMPNINLENPQRNKLCNADTLDYAVGKSDVFLYVWNNFNFNKIKHLISFHDAIVIPIMTLPPYGR